MPRSSDGWMLDVVEAAYRVQPSLAAWNQHLVETAEPHLATTMGLTFATFQHRDGERPRFNSFGFTQNLPEPLRPIFLGGDEHLTADQRALMFESPCPSLDVASERLGYALADSPTFETFIACGVRELTAALGCDVAGNGFALSAPHPRRPRFDSVDRRRWTFLRDHILAGLRLHAAPVEATLAPDGRMLDGEPATTHRDAREALRAAAIRIDRARCRSSRRDPEAAMEFWRGLVDGRWSLVDRFDSDGRRFVVAYRNDPQLVQPRRLTPKERRVVTYASLGRSNKEIAYELGLAASTVSSHLGSALSKLGMRRRTDLLSLGSLAPVREEDLVVPPAAAVHDPRNPSPHPGLAGDSEAAAEGGSL